jgi:hypothetical protein
MPNAICDLVPIGISRNLMSSGTSRLNRPIECARPDTRRFNKHCATTTSTRSVSLDFMFLTKLNPVEPPDR